MGVIRRPQAFTKLYKKKFQREVVGRQMRRELKASRSRTLEASGLKKQGVSVPYFLIMPDDTSLLTLDRCGTLEMLYNKCPFL